MIEKLEQQLEEAITAKDWESAEKISDLLDKHVAREKEKSEIVHAERKSIMVLVGAIVTTIGSLISLFGALF